MIQADKATVQYVLGSLLKKPQLLSQVDKYSLTVLVFSNKFERLIYTAIDGLYRNNATVINPIDVDNYLNSDTSAHAVFESNHGIEYLADIVEFGSVENFDYYYNRLKKFNLLRDLQKSGVDISSFYVEDLANPKANEINEKFESLTTTDIINGIKRKLLKVESDYGNTDEIEVETAADDIDEFITQLATTSELGIPVQGEIYNEIISGAQRGALTIRSGSSGLGKTRQAVADACYLAYPMRYDCVAQKWIQTGSSEKVLFIITEQTMPQIKKMILAYLTDMNESVFKYGNLSGKEEALIQQAAAVMKKFKDNFIILKCPNPTIEGIKTLIRENVLTHDIGYVFYDYIFIGPALLGEFRGFNLRNDELLLMFATALKDLAVELNVAMFTSTQVNAQADNNTNIRNEASLAGGRATINKADNGAIMARPTTEELETMSELISKFGQPNMVTDIFKVRSGQWTQVRIWSIFDAGTLKKKDLYITDARMMPIEDFMLQYTYDVKHWEETEKKEIVDIIERLNDGEIID